MERLTKAPGTRLRRWLREPLLHFLALGGLLFLVFQWRGSGPESSRIVITPGRIDSLATGFARTWQRAPTEAELEALVGDYVREEVAVREATALGLDRDDTVIRRRLRQKLEFVAEEAFKASPPTDEELRAFLDAHAERFRREPEVAFRQVYFSPDRRGVAAHADAQALAARLAAAGPAAVSEAAGDPLAVPREVGLAPHGEVARWFGEEFADRVLTLEPGRWLGPIPSGYGLHVVYVLERREARMPALEEVRREVEGELASERRRRELEAMYERLLERYRVTVQERSPPAGAGTASGAGAGR
jgi:hypothetical protein